MNGNVLFVPTNIVSPTTPFTSSNSLNFTKGVPSQLNPYLLRVNLSDVGGGNQFMDRLIYIFPPPPPPTPPLPPVTTPSPGPSPVVVTIGIDGLGAALKTEDFAVLQNNLQKATSGATSGRRALLQSSVGVPTLSDYNHKAVLNTSAVVASSLYAAATTGIQKDLIANSVVATALLNVSITSSSAIQVVVSAGTGSNLKFTVNGLTPSGFTASNRMTTALPAVTWTTTSAAIAPATVGSSTGGTVGALLTVNITGSGAAAAATALAQASASTLSALSAGLPSCAAPAVCTVSVSYNVSVSPSSSPASKKSLALPLGLGLGLGLGVPCLAAAAFVGMRFMKKGGGAVAAAPS